MNTEITRLLSLEAIRNLRIRYCHHLDANHMDELARLFTEEATCFVAGIGWQGREAIRAGLTQAFEEYDALHRGTYPFMHVIANHWIEFINDDHAEGRCYLTDWVTERPAGTSPLLLLGSYADEYLRIDGKWLINRTRLDITWPEPDIGGGAPGNDLILPSKQS
ncbi:conserved hypothetical protein [Dickeya chrysanthemi Ech1591]|uniref:SnoaL-like domain-containing protein n=1 Tax=Dickeya chrysanthemi (strain Ech1591) TaxID=561229 RepID=C6CHH4_DICC1|nr:nuclear transport factor 2 family protein [Dickeya chrysanthemi]ACT06875.1 conserved hypothetical protein [Dickeya chrysanthemi Ech1591]